MPPATPRRWAACCRPWAAWRPPTRSSSPTARAPRSTPASRRSTTRSPRRRDSRRAARAAGLLLGPLRRGGSAGGPRPVPVRRAADARATGARRPAGRHFGLVRVGGVHAPQGRHQAPALPDGQLDRHARARLLDVDVRRRAGAGVGPDRGVLFHVLPAVGPARRRRRQSGPARDAAGGVSVRVAGDAGPHRTHAGRPPARGLRIRSDRHRRHGRHRRPRDGVGPDPATRAERPHHRAAARRRP